MILNGDETAVWRLYDYLAALRETPRVDSLSRARNTRLLSQCRIWMKLTDLLCLCQTSNALEHVICCPWKLH